MLGKDYKLQVLMIIDLYESAVVEGNKLVNIYAELVLMVF